MACSAHVLGSPPALQAVARLPDVLKSLPISQGLFKLAASTSERKYGKVYPRATEVHNVVQNTQIPGADFQPIVDGLLNKFIGSFQVPTFCAAPLILVRRYVQAEDDRALGESVHIDPGYAGPVVPQLSTRAGSYWYVRLGR